MAEVFEPSAYTLFVSFIPVYLYFVLHKQYWYYPRTIKKIDLTLQFSAGALALAAFYLITQNANLQEPEKLLFALLHLAPLALVFLVIYSLKTDSIPRGSQQKISQESKQGGYTPTPQSDEIENLSWDQLILNKDLKKELLSVIELLKNPESAKQYGIETPRGILLEGPPGTGKTTLAKVVASTAGLSFFVLRMDDVISQWVGESEKNLTQLFKAATEHAPAVIFIDEVDSIGKARSGGGAGWSDNLLNHMLQLIDGVIKTEGIYVIAATNRSELVDSALKRPGRLNKVVEVPLPDNASRKEIFKLHLSSLNLSPTLFSNGFDLDELCHHTEGASGAVIKAICNQAGLNAFSRESATDGAKNYQVTTEDLILAINEFTSSKAEDIAKNS